ncbi:MAG: DUF2232 domain-containing protein [Gemmatimonadaceae bacterium]
MSRLFAPGWRSALLAVVVFLVFPSLPTAVRSVLPIAETWVLLAAALAVCATLGWWNGGGAWPAVAAVLLAWYAVTAPVGIGPGNYPLLVRGWVVLLAAAFGVASLVTPGQHFLRRALAALGIAAAVAFAVAVATPDGVASVTSVMQTEFNGRTEQTVAFVNEGKASPAWRDLVKRSPGIDSVVRTNESDLRTLGGRAPRTVSSFVALESLLALALGWMIYHRLSEVRLGPPLGTVKEFRFNDQLIWGLAVGATIFFLPVFADGKDAGLNLLVFFGALYLFRGVGVLSFMSRSKWSATIMIIMTIFAPLLLGALALGVGVGDTWMDWRTRVQENT